MTYRTFLIQGCVAGLLAQIPAASNPPLIDPSSPTAKSLSRQQQAGYPRCVAWWAIPSDTGSYAISQVGGGCPFPNLADGPLPSEGTWGWDYVGRYLRSDVILGGWHDRRFQGGTGAYQTDGPTLNHGEGTLKSLHDR